MTRATTLGMIALLVAGAILPAVPVHALPILADVFSEPRPFTEASAPALPEKGEHVVVHVSNLDPYSVEQAVIRLANPVGEEVMHALIVGTSSLYVTDGYAEDGSVRYVKIVRVGYDPVRLDLFANGDTVLLHPQGGGDPVTLEAFHNATEVTQVDASDLASHQAILHRVGFYPADARVEDFYYRYATLSDPENWQTHDPEDRLELVNTSGHLSYGRLEVSDTLWVPPVESVAYVHADVSTYGGRYIAEASFRPWAVGIDFPDGVPDHQAVLSGLSGPADDPTVHWALTVAFANDTVPGVNLEYDRWSFYLVDAEGHRTRVGDGWGQDEWHTARVFVDEGNGTLAIQVDDGDPVKVFQGGLAPSDRVAAGDVWTGDLRWTGGGTGYYDNLAVTPWEVDT